MKARFRVGCVPYVNARPLVACFDQPNEFVEVVYDVPSRLPALLDSGEVDAILVSSIEYLRRDDLVIAADVGIMSNGPVASVRMLSKVPLEEIKTLALDESSMTSNMLAQIILAERGVRPALVTMEPDQAAMLAACDACVLIGDKGLEADGTGLVDIDLGAAWTELTGEPFFWALWLRKQNSDPNDIWHVPWDAESMLLSRVLEAGYRASGFEELHQLDAYVKRNSQKMLEDRRYLNSFHFAEHHSALVADRRDFVIRDASLRSGWSLQQVDDYLRNNVRFLISAHFQTNVVDRNCTSEFGSHLRRHGLIDNVASHVQIIQNGNLEAEIHKLIPSKLPYFEAITSRHPHPVESER